MTIGDAVMLASRDPVCQMRITEDHVVERIRHGAIELRFSSLECLATFAEAPQRYANVPGDCEAPN